MKMNSTTWIIILVLIIALLSTLMFKRYLSPIIDTSEETYKKIDSLNNIIKGMEEYQKKLDSTIYSFNTQMDSVDSNINNIKGQKTVIKEIYYEKTNRVNSYDRNQVDSFFSDRYPRN